MILRPRLQSRFRRFLLYPIEAAVVSVAYGVFAALPIDAASALGGWLARTFGPRLSLSRRAVANLGRAYPEKGAGEIAKIVRGMWDNLGRTAAEYPHLGEIDVYGNDGRVEVVGAENVDRLRDDGKPGIFFSGHLGNWEILSLGATQRGLPLDRIYRAANNRLVEWLYRRGRTAVEGALIPKGPAGARRLIASLKKGRHLGMLVDQKMNDGIPAPFFGRAAMTAPALAEFALRYEFPVVAARVVRLSGARFRLVISPPMELESTGERQADVARAMAQVNAVIEGWVRDTPEQWLWLHNRWGAKGRRGRP
ncbi:MAG: lipid A biosynthesis lauroyl acyltransferase [Rhodospirillales bacterium]|jgi:KDO2-lipid IV(A) lauroyltransferase|nr:lipid A biosynthesis lauroyl acyltransferase [Rhodospirillales bacterium]MDP6804028.1 lipid A biosynthesis lauroyl acyltransferase [Rhodospirillales bacterium]